MTIALGFPAGPAPNLITRQPAGIDTISLPFSAFLSPLPQHQATMFCATGPLGLARHTLPAETVLASRVSPWAPPPEAAAATTSSQFVSYAASDPTLFMHAWTSPAHTGEPQSGALASRTLPPSGDISAGAGFAHREAQSVRSNRPAPASPPRREAPLAARTNAIAVKLQGSPQDLSVLAEVPVRLSLETQALAAGVQTLLREHGYAGALFINGRKVTSEKERFNV